LESFRRISASRGGDGDPKLGLLRQGALEEGDGASTEARVFECGQFRKKDGARERRRR